MCVQPAHRLGVQVLRPPSQPCQSHVLDHPRTQWRHGGSPFAYVPTAPPQARRFKGYTPLTTTPGRPTVTLGEAVPSNYLRFGSQHVHLRDHVFPPHHTVSLFCHFW